MKKMLCLALSLMMLLSVSAMAAPAEAEDTSDQEVDALLSLLDEPTLLEPETEPADVVAKKVAVKETLKENDLLYVDESNHLMISPDAWNVIEDTDTLDELSESYAFGNESVDIGLLGVDAENLEFYSVTMTKENIDKIAQADYFASVNNGPARVREHASDCSLTKVAFGKMVRANLSTLKTYYNKQLELAVLNPKVDATKNTVSLWISKVKSKGPWDYKTVSPYAPYNKTLCLTYGVNDSKKSYHKTSEFMGNYNYGYTGRFLFPLAVLKVGSNTAAGNPFVKDKADYPAIEEGFADYR